MDIKIESGGITHAIKAKLAKQNYDVSNVNISIWTKVMDAVKAENDQRVNEGNSGYYSGGSNINESGHENFVVQKAAILSFSEKLWNTICGFFNKKSVSNTQAPNQTGPAIHTQGVNRPDYINEINNLKDTPKTSEAAPPEELKKNVENARKYLTEQLKNLSEDDLKQMGISPAKRDRILQYLQNITYGTDHNSAQAKGGGIVFSIYCKDTDNLANMVTLLMHEANHCDEKYLSQYPDASETGDLRHRKSDGTPVVKQLINTKEEEIACETLGLLTTAALIKKGVLTGYDNYGRYGQKDNNGSARPVTEYLDHPELLQKDVKNWADQYTNYPEGFNNPGATIEHLNIPDVKIPDEVKNQKIELKAGDIIKVGDKEYTINPDDENGIMLCPMDSLPALQIIPHGDVQEGTQGTIVFDNVKPTKSEKDFFSSQHNNDNHIYEILDDNKPSNLKVSVIRNGQVVYEGTCYR